MAVKIITDFNNGAVCAIIIQFTSTDFSTLCNKTYPVSPSTTRLKKKLCSCSAGRNVMRKAYSIPFVLSWKSVTW
ncbi:MAG: hypothetical protein EOO47_04995 [Flavobacterium sp.]|nr:MAG: hypothetical protein EOO47_04995 [Flavobacterium sp.]